MAGGARTHRNSAHAPSSRSCLHEKILGLIMREGKLTDSCLNTFETGILFLTKSEYSM